MKKRTRNRLIFIVIIAMVIYLIVLNQIQLSHVIGGDWNIITDQLVGYLPQLIGIGLGFVLIIKDRGYSETASGRLLLMMGLEGIFFASLFYELNNDAIWIDELITATFTITDLQIVTILFFLLLGVLIGLIRR